MSFTEREKIALSIAPHISSVFSVIGSSFVVYEVVRDRTKRKKIYHRLLLVFSSFDCITSVALGLSTWPIPKGTEGVYAARGTTATCTAQGFFLQLSIISPIYNALLAFYFLLLIRNGVAEHTIVGRYEPYMHACALTFALGLAFAGLGLKLYNSANLWCWIAPYPSDCQGSRGQSGNIECERGFNAWIYRWVFFYAPLWFTIVVVSLFMGMIWYTVRQYELRSAGNDTESRRRFEKSRKVTVQALSYVVAFYITWIFGTINRLLQLFTGESYFPLMLLHSIFTPAQGFLNFLVYFRPKMCRKRKETRESQNSSLVSYSSSMWFSPLMRVMESVQWECDEFEMSENIENETPTRDQATSEELSIGTVHSKYAENSRSIGD